MRKGLLALSIIALVALSGCATPTTYEKAEYDRIVAQGNPPIKTYDPLTAGLLNLLPGIGDAYNGQWGAFVGNFLLWPISVVWGVPEAAITAENQNTRETVYYYTLGIGKELRKGAP